MDLMDYRRKIIANSPHLKSASGAVATFSDGADLPLKSLSVGIEPVQDLHGYDSPWVAGGGVNKLPPMVDGTYTGNGLTAVVKNGVATLSGTSTASGNALTIPLAEEYTVTQGYLHLCNSVANASFAPTLEDVNAISASSVAWACSPVNRVGAIPSDKIGQKWNRVRVWISSGVTISGTYAPMVCADNTVRSYAPYENICPISGWNGVNLTRCGKNLWKRVSNSYPVSSYDITYSLNADGSIHVQGTASGQSNNYPIASNGMSVYAGTYTMSVKTTDPNIHFIFGGGNGTAGIAYTDMVNGSKKTFTTNGGTTGHNIIRVNSGATVNGDIYIQLEKGSSSTATPWEPYNGVNVSIDLGQTVYGGTLNVLTGVLTVDRANISITDYLTGIQNNGARNGNQLIALAVTGKKAGTDNFISNLFFISSSAVGKYTMHGRATSTTIEFEIPFSALGVTEEDPVNVRLSAATQWFTDNPTQLCYELATPYETQLTPHQIRTLYGNNTIFADTGNVALEYWAHP